MLTRDTWRLAREKIQSQMLRGTHLFWSVIVTWPCDTSAGRGSQVSPLTGIMDVIVGTAPG